MVLIFILDNDKRERERLCCCVYSVQTGFIFGMVHLFIDLISQALRDIIPVIFLQVKRTCNLYQNSTFKSQVLVPQILM
ncbi:hypothetical protein BCR42DRAFT_430019 [Absidia repens]|uniref:Uncharacterized protein n=1 Tax=Absidia repens TaxID=90262 RepID=A0A1X2HLY2_9FUNG|nr:hypothetical protein BCR42DRAFT_430019 [Absidia repens]